MSLIVSSGVGKLRVETVNQRTASRVALGLITENCSFYCEPEPFGRVSFYVDEEHLAAVRRLIKEKPCVLPPSSVL